MHTPSDTLIFTNRDEWRAWLEAHHAEADAVWLLLYKKRFRDAGLTLDEAVEEALCYGWIDGQLKSVDEKSYTLRFSPRRPDSVWSARNQRRVARLIQEGRMTPVGLGSGRSG